MSQANATARFLDTIERLGNRLPHPTLLFVWLSLLVIILSAVSAALGVQAVHPSSGETIVATSLLSTDGIQKILLHTVSNFTQFAPLGTVLVAMLGIGIAERSGLIPALLKLLVAKAPDRALTFTVVLAGVLSSLAADAGYVVLIPLAALIFQAAGRPPIAGIAAAFAGVSGGFSANILVGPVDAILAGLSSEAAVLVDPTYEVAATANYYFLIASTLMIAVIGTLVTEWLVLPRQTQSLQGQSLETTSAPNDSQLTPEERKGLKASGMFALVFIGLMLWGLFAPEPWLRAPDADITKSPFMKGIVTVIALFGGLAGLVFGRVSGQFATGSDAIDSMEETMKTMASYLVLMFFAAQFIAYFKWTNLGLITAIHGADFLRQLDTSPTVLLGLFILITASINLLIGSASAKWAVMAPVFVPMLMLLGISPEATQMAYRIGDSTTNIITPLMPYFAIVVAFVQQYDKKAGMGTMIALMLPYSLALLIGWSILMGVWITAGWPLGPDAAVLLPTTP